MRCHSGGTAAEVAAASNRISAAATGSRRASTGPARASKKVAARKKGRRIVTGLAPGGMSRLATMAGPERHVMRRRRVTWRPLARCNGMPDEDCLNLRLGDYFHQRREPDAPAGEDDAETADREPAPRD
jgi:hypothetical protein